MFTRIPAHNFFFRHIGLILRNVTAHKHHTQYKHYKNTNMRKTVRLIEMQGNYFFLSNDPVNTKERAIEVRPDGSLSENIIVNESSSPLESGMKIVYSSEKLGWFSSETSESNIKKIIRAELRPSKVREIMENGGSCEIECIVETKTFGTGEFDFYESDVNTPYLINDLPVINLV